MTEASLTWREMMTSALARTNHLDQHEFWFRAEAMCRALGINPDAKPPQVFPIKPKFKPVVTAPSPEVRQ